MGRRLRGRIISFAKKPLLDLCRDLNQPFLCAVGSIPIMFEVSLEVLYTLLSVLKLIRKFMSYVDRVVVIFVTYVGRLVK
jgi:hypothetical protein